MEQNQTTGFNESDQISCVLPHYISEEQWMFYHAFTWWLEGFASVLIGSMGIIFNTTTIFVLLGSELAASFFNWLLVSLAVFDIFFLLNGILEAFRTHLGLGTNIHDIIFVEFLFPFRSIVMCCSMYTTVLLALERYNALVRPISHQGPGLRAGRLSLKTHFIWHWARLLKYVAPIIILSTLFYIPKRLEIELVKKEMCYESYENGSYYDYKITDDNFSTDENCTVKYEIELTDLRSNNHYILWYQNVSNLLITAVIPLVSLIYLNLSIYLKFKDYLQRQPLTARPSTNTNVAPSHAQERARKREKDMIQQTMILFAIVILFGVFHILRIILNIEEFLSHDNNTMASEKGCDWLQYWTIIAAPVSHLLLQINSSINFFIYCFFNKAFRDELVSRLKLLSIPTFLKIKRAPTNNTTNVPNLNTINATTKETMLITNSHNVHATNGRNNTSENVELHDIRTVICE